MTGLREPTRNLPEGRNAEIPPGGKLACCLARSLSELRSNKPLNVGHRSRRDKNMALRHRRWMMRHKRAGPSRRLEVLGSRLDPQLQQLLLKRRN